MGPSQSVRCSLCMRYFGVFPFCPLFPMVLCLGYFGIIPFCPLFPMVCAWDTLELSHSVHCFPWFVPGILWNYPILSIVSHGFVHGILWRCFHSVHACFASYGTVGRDGQFGWKYCAGDPLGGSYSVHCYMNGMDSWDQQD